MAKKKVRLYVTKDKPSTQLTVEEIEAIRKSHQTMSFEELVEEWWTNTKAMNGEATMEWTPPHKPFKQTGPPWESRAVVDSRNIRLYAMGMGDDNPLFTDPEYGKTTRYGCQIAPCTMSFVWNYSGIHGFGSWADRPGFSYPIAEFISGLAAEFYDVARVGTRFLTEIKQRETFEKKGATAGRLFFLISEGYNWNYHKDLLSKYYGTLIKTPMEARRDVERIGDKMIYDRTTYKYSQEEITAIVDCLESETRRGATPLYWEDVEVGDKLGPIVVPPWTIRDMQPFHIMGAYEGGFEFNYKYSVIGVRMEEFVNPATRWPYDPSAEHEDAIVCKYRGMALPFDFGFQRFQIPARLLYNWMGDDGFIRTMYVALRKAVYWSDTTWYSGEVVRKYKITEKGEAGRSAPELGATKGVPGEAEYAAVGIKIVGKNQLGEDQCPGTARVYLPSRELGPVKLPIPHPPRPPYVPFLTHRRDWY